MEILSVLNQKGGVGKTTVAWHIAVGLAEKGYRVLAVDNDVQGSLSRCLLGSKSSEGMLKTTDIYEGALGGTLTSVRNNLWLSVGNKGLEKFFLDKYSTKKFSDTLTYIAKAAKIDIVVIDNSPQPTRTTETAMALSTKWLLVLKPEPLPIEGLIQTYERLEELKKKGNSGKLLGIVISMYKGFSSSGHMLRKLSLKRKFKKHVLNTTLGERVAFSDASERGEPVTQAFSGSKAAKEVHSLVNEVEKRLNLKRK